jgi:5-methylcytosine-specific restriction endonuclease McrA
MPSSPPTHRATPAPPMPAHHAPRPDERPSPSARGYDRTWQRLRKMALHASPVCAECGRLATEVHHMRPIADGGARLEQANLQPLCHACHNRETARARRKPTMRGDYHG